MAEVLTPLTIDLDGNIDAEVSHDAGTGAPFYTHCNDDPSSSSSDYIQNSLNEANAVGHFALTNVDSDFSSMATLNINVDVIALGFDGGDTCTLTARILDDVAGVLSGETGNIASDADTTRTQRTVAFSFLAGTKAQWDTAHVRFTWTYSKSAGPDNAQVRLFGCDFDGTYNASAGSGHPRAMVHQMKMMGGG